ncbi:MAG TPA: glycosyltransferase family A protein [Anaerolineaceae bacterium]|nr:glycosyltransferase family A protein [Anaerolineaceae bacterium]
MRKGQNPAKKDVLAYRPEKLAIVSLVYIPVQEGYFADALKIFEYHLASVRQYTPEPFNLVVFDNGSCAEVKQALLRLQTQGWIDWLVVSKDNLGKTGALNWILGALPNEWICFADSDMLFRPGWLEASWKIQASFPDCGMIGAQVVFPDLEVDRGNSRLRKTTDPRFRFGQVKPDAWILDEYIRGRGVSDERAADYRAMALDQVENIESGVKVFLGGNSHQQWLAKSEVIRKILPLPASHQLSREEDTYQDRRLDELGFAHLTTTVPYLYHMGNTVDVELEPELARLKLLDGSQITTVSEPAQSKHNLAWRSLVWMNSQPRLRRILLRLYNNLYLVFSSSPKR